MNYGQPDLNTSRLILKELSRKDIPYIHTLHSLPETDRYNTLGIPKDISATTRLVETWINDQEQQPRKLYIFSIFLNSSEEFIGLIAILLGKNNFRNAEVWYKISPKHWNMGYTTEALDRILKFAFEELNLHRIEAGCAIENLASARVLEKAGFKLEGTKRKNLPIRGEWKDSFSFAILEKSAEHTASILEE